MDTPARSPEDIIGIIPHTLGYVPRDSLVAVIVGTEPNGTQGSSTTLRVDFTLETAAEILRKGGSGYVDLIGRAFTATGVFLVVYDEGYQPITGLPACDDAVVHRGLVHAAIDELAQSFASDGIDTLGAWWVSQEQFGRIDEDGNDPTPLIEATTSPCATELVANGSNPVGSAQELVIAPMTAEAYAHSRRGHLGEWMGMDEAFVILADVYAKLHAMRADDEPIDEAQLHAMLDLPTVMALDALLVEKWSRDALEMILSFDHPDFPPALIVDLDGEQLCDRARRFSARADSAHEIVGLSARAPRPRDVMLSIAFLKEYLPQSHPQVRADTYAVIAWFEWALGGSTMAENYAMAAIAIESEHGLANLIMRAVQFGFLPRWLMEEEQSTF